MPWPNSAAISRTRTPRRQRRRNSRMRSVVHGEARRCGVGRTPLDNGNITPPRIVLGSKVTTVCPQCQPPNVVIMQVVFAYGYDSRRAATHGAREALQVGAHC